MSFFLAPFISMEIGAQGDCALKLREAQEMFNTGRIEKVYDLLKNCISTGLTKEERLQAYKLMINACVFDGNNTLAENYMNEFLRKYPEYIPSSADPVEFSGLLKQYDNLPRVSLGIYGGINTSLVSIIEYYGVHDLNVEEGKYSSAGFGFQTGITVIKHFGKNFELGLEPRFRESRYEYNLNPYPFAKVKYMEKQDKIDIPVSFSYTGIKSFLNPYIKTGCIASMLLTANSNIIRSYENTGGTFYNDIESPSLNISDNRNPLNITISLGGGVKYKLSKGFFFLDLSYNCTILNETKDNSREPGNDDQSLIYFYEDNDYRLNYFAVSAGFAYSFYKPKKL